MTRRLTWLVLVVASFGCSDAHRSRGVEPDAGPGAPDAGPGEPPPEGPATALPAPPTRTLTDEEAEWADASDFEIQLEGTRCYGSCPAYKLTLFANGDLRFTGNHNTWNPGTYELQRTAATAAELYRNLIRRGFLGLKTRYSKAEDGCPELWTDHPTTNFTLRAGTREKKVTYYEGCRGKLAALATMDTMRREIIELTEIEPYLKGAFGCSRYLELDELSPSYVLRTEDDRSVGLLRIEPNGSEFGPSWRVTMCDGRELASAERLHRWGCGWAMAPTESTLDWPGVDVMPAAVLLQRARTKSELEVRLFTFDAELSQRVQQGDACF
jgi:hypothetical protein